MSDIFKLPVGWVLAPTENPDNYTDDLGRSDIAEGVPCPVIINESDDRHPIGLFMPYMQSHLRIVMRND